MPVMSLKFAINQCRGPYFTNYKELLCIPPRGALKSRRGPHINVILGPKILPIPEQGQ